MPSPADASGSPRAAPKCSIQNAPCRLYPTAITFTGSAKTFSDRVATVYGSEGWGVGSLRVRPGQRPLRSCRGCHYRRRWLVIHDGVGRDYRGKNDQRGAGHRYCPGQRCCSKPTSSQRGQELSGCDDEKHATMGDGDCRASQDLMATCHGVRMVRVSSNTRGLPRDRWLVPFETSLTVRARGSMNETGKPVLVAVRPRSRLSAGVRSTGLSCVAASREPRRT